ncbi:MAG: S1C family serine protease [Planctomycetota bacterium]
MIDAIEQEPDPNPSHSSVPAGSVRAGSAPAGSAPTVGSLLVSTMFSLGGVLILLVCLRYLLPPMLESSRYSWHRGQLRAEYELAGQQLQNVSWEGLSEISQTVTRRVNPSVVHIQVSLKDEDSERLGRWNPDLQGFRAPSGQGSGIVVSADGYILTNYHVLESNSDIQVYLPDNRTLPAKVVGVDRTTDLALLKVDANGLLPIAWGDSDEVDIGSPVWAIGSPFGLAGSVSFGILSGKHRIDLNANPQYRGSRERITSRYSDLMQSDVAVNPGNSGGPLVNGRGELIGINTAIVGESYRGVSFSIPSRIAREVLDQFMAHGRVRRGWLGVELAAEIVPEGETTVPRVVVRSVAPDSPANRAGIYPGDRILEFNGKPVGSVQELIDSIRTTPAEASALLKLDRDGSEVAIELTLGELNYAP